MGEKAGEDFELPEVPEGHQDYRYTLPVSLTISILAVLVAGATLLGHRAHTEELLLQSRATDQWSYYQAKNIRFHEVQSIADLLGALAPADKEDISEKAKEFEKERDLISRRADRFDGGEALLEVGLVICSITLLTRRRLFWVGGVLIGAVGVVTALTGLFLH